ncbi:cytochrome P450 [Panaeolus papilionaceus]|nr:cytochrome P450 [Panaeolus papilionaceus]
MNSDDSTLLSGSLTTTLVGASLCALLLKYALRKPQGPYPPGPEPKPIIGNALDIPLKGAGKIYMDWGRKYNSKIIYLNALGQRLIVLNSVDDANELFENRASIYSDRSVVPTTEMVGWEYNLALYTYGDKWRTHRRICQQNFNAQNAKQYRPVQIRKVHEMLSGLLETPERFLEHNRMLAVSLPLTTMYGYEVKHLEDPAVIAADKGVEIGIQVFSPGGSFANILPILKYVPWTWTQRMAKEAREATEIMKRIPLESLKEDMAAGVAPPSLVGNFLEKKQTRGASTEEEEAVFNVANTTYGAASETTMSATLSFIWLMATHPDIQAKAQAELDAVLGVAESLPNFDDRESTPYVEAIYREVMRLCPPLPSAIPHVALVDDWYKGYFIPKGTAVLGNVWGMNRDEEKYEDPMSFKPERFLMPDGKINDNDRILAYGFGRRVCVGKHVASSTLWLTFASILACFNITKKKDPNGNEIDIDDEMHEVGLLSHKAPFECAIHPRSEAWKHLIEISK